MVSRKRLVGIIAGIFWGVFLASLAGAAQERPILVSCPGTDRVLKYDETTGDFLGELIGPGQGVKAPKGLTFGPDGFLYVCSSGNNKIFKYNWRSGELTEFEGAENGRLERPETLVFGQDNSLYVSSGDDLVKWYDADGVYQGNFVSSDPVENGGLTRPRGMAFDKSWNLYVTSNDDSSVKKYNTAGVYQGNFVSSGTAGEEDELGGPRGVLFGTNGNFYVASRKTDNVLRYDGSDGDFFDIFASNESIDPEEATLNAPTGILFASDGNLLVCSSASNQVLQFDGESGVFIRVFAEGITPEDDLAYLAQVPADEDPPVMVNNTGVTIDEGGTASITRDDLLYDDAQGPASINYTVDPAPLSGQLELNTTPGTPITSFTQEDIDDGLLNYVNFGTDNADADSFGFKIDDGLGNVLEGQSFSITVTLIDNDPPELVNNTGSKVVQGGSVVITKSNLEYSDDQGPTNITYFVTPPPVEGDLELDGNKVSEFTQQDIDDGLLVYVNKTLGDKSDLFGFRVGDGLGNVRSDQSYSITITPDPTEPGDGEETTTNDDDDDDQTCWVSVCVSRSPLEKALYLLRELRDRFLMCSPFGRAFVKLYYETSPPIAQYMARHDALRTTVQCSLVPVVYGVKYPKTTGLVLLWTVVSTVALVHRRRK